MCDLIAESTRSYRIFQKEGECNHYPRPLPLEKYAEIATV